MDKITGLVRDDILEIFKEGYKEGEEIAKGISGAIGNWANLQKKSWIRGKIVIAFIGEFSAGKTSIVNRVFSQDKPGALQLKVSAGASTAIATYISYGRAENGRAENAKFTDKNGELKEVSIETLNQFTKKSLENVKASELVTHFVVEYPNENLEKLSILDTPGFSSGDKEDEKRTSEVIQEADALFWVVDAHTGEINTTSLDIIRRNMGEIPLYIVINKVDDMSPADRDKVAKKIRETAEKAQIPVRDYIQFSRKEPLETLMEVIASIAPKNTEYDVIDDIRQNFKQLQEFYEDRIDEQNEAIKTCQREINQADSIIDSFSESFNAKVSQFNNLTRRMKSDEIIGSTFFGNGNKIKDVALFWDLHTKQIGIFNDCYTAYNEYTDATKNKMKNQSKHEKHKISQTEFKEKLSRVKKVKNQFNKDMEFFKQ